MTTTVAAPGVAVVMPVRAQACELPGAVAHVLGTLAGCEYPHTVVIVDDASPDGTADVADELARQYPGRVEVLRHDTHQGYRAALRTGMEAALARTGHETVVLADVGGRFRAEDLPTLVRDATTERADVVLGHRHDARPRWSSALGPARWRRAPACTYTVVHRDVLECEGQGVPDGAGLPVGKDLVSRAQARGARVVRRVLGADATDDRPPRRTRARRTWRDGDVRSRRRARDPVLRVVTAVSSFISLAAFVVTLATNTVLTYPDAVAHLLIARRVVDSPTAGPAQLGGVWLPLPHVAAAPAAAIDPLYLSGAAGSAVSMVAFVLAVRWVYLIVDELTGSRPAAVCGAAVLALCPNVLYMQSTPMSELPLLAGIAGATYYLVRWIRTDRHQDLALAGAALFLVTLVRYEAWPFCAAGLAVVAINVWRRSGRSQWRGRWLETESRVIYAALLALAGIAGWILWNAAIFRDPLFFFDGEYSESSVWVGQEEKTAGDLGITLQTWWYAVADNVGAPLTVVGCMGLVVLLLRTRLRGVALAAVTPLVLLPFFLAFLYLGQRPLHVLEITGDRNNVRFGLIMVVPLAIGVGYAMGRAAALLRRRPVVIALATVVVVLIGVASAFAASHGVATLAEARSFRNLPFEQGNARAAAWLRTHYDGGTLLMNNFGNQTVAFDSGVPTSEIVYDGSYGLWTPALADPAANGIAWIYMRSGAAYPDPVWEELSESPVLAPYRLVYDADGRRIYHLESPPLPQRSESPR